MLSVAPALPRESASTIDFGVAVADRGLALIQDGRFDPGLSANWHPSDRLTIRSDASTTMVVGSHQQVATFQQVEILRVVRSSRRSAVWLGGGVRQEWDGGQALIARVVASARLGSFDVAGNAVIEKALSGVHDAEDVIVSAGIMRTITPRVSFGLECVGRDLEGFWDPHEDDGGARLLIGPSLHLGLPRARWAVGLTGGPMVQSTSTIARPDATALGPATISGHFALLGTITYSPSAPR